MRVTFRFTITILRKRESKLFDVKSSQTKSKSQHHHDVHVHSETTVAKLRKDKEGYGVGVAIHCKRFGHHVKFVDIQGWR
jgi:hypothetical protein